MEALVSTVYGGGLYRAKSQRNPFDIVADEELRDVAMFGDRGVCLGLSRSGPNKILDPGSKDGEVQTCSGEVGVLTSGASESRTNVIGAR